MASVYGRHIVWARLPRKMRTALMYISIAIGFGVFILFDSFGLSGEGLYLLPTAFFALSGWLFGLIIAALENWQRRLALHVAWLLSLALTAVLLVHNATFQEIFLGIVLLWLMITQLQYIVEMAMDWAEHPKMPPPDSLRKRLLVHVFGDDWR